MHLRAVEVLCIGRPWWSEFEHFPLGERIESVELSHVNRVLEDENWDPVGIQNRRMNGAPISLFEVSAGGRVDWHCVANERGRVWLTLCKRAKHRRSNLRNIGGVWIEWIFWKRVKNVLAQDLRFRPFY